MQLYILLPTQNIWLFQPVIVIGISSIGESMNSQNLKLWIKIHNSATSLSIKNSFKSKRFFKEPKVKFRPIQKVLFDKKQCKVIKNNYFIQIMLKILPSILFV